MKPMTDKRIIERELEGFGIRLNRSPPDIILKRKDKGGLNITTAHMMDRTFLNDDLVKTICQEYRISNADIHFRCNATADDLIDVIEGNRKYCSCIYVMNKIDQTYIEDLDIICKVPHYVPISAKDEWNLDGLMEKVWEYLDLIRIYTKPKGQIPDYDEPVVIPRSATKIEDLCDRLHKGLKKEFKHALVWGMSAKHNPQKCGKEHVL